MVTLPHGKYLKGLKGDAGRLFAKYDMTAGKISQLRDIPKSTVEGWFRLHKRGKLSLLAKA